MNFTAVVFSVRALRAFLDSWVMSSRNTVHLNWSQFLRARAVVLWATIFLYEQPFLGWWISLMQCVYTSCYERPVYVCFTRDPCTCAWFLSPGHGSLSSVICFGYCSPASRILAYVFHPYSTRIHKTSQISSASFDLRTFQKKTWMWMQTTIVG